MEQPQVKGTKIMEQFILSKLGDLTSCEDCIHISENFIAVFDGVTSKAEKIPPNLKPGGILAREISTGLTNLSPDANCSEALDLLSNVAKIFLQKSDLIKFNPAAAAIIFSVQRRELWQVGDCKYAFDGKDFDSDSEIDAHAASIRAAFNRALLIEGRSIDDLKSDDEGRNVIMPMLKKQLNFLNRAGEKPFGYSCFNGEAIPDELHVIHSIPESVKEVTLASDGYPKLLSNLAEAEEYLTDILTTDPLCINKHIATKGLQLGQVSFDDRAYVRIALD